MQSQCSHRDSVHVKMQRTKHHLGSIIVSLTELICPYTGTQFALVQFTNICLIELRNYCFVLKTVQTEIEFSKSIAVRLTCQLKSFACS